MCEWQGQEPIKRHKIGRKDAPIVAYKTVTVGALSGDVRSVQQETLWRKLRLRARVNEPQPMCFRPKPETGIYETGIYAWRLEPWSSQHAVVAKVELRGKVFEYHTGYRASRAKIVGLTFGPLVTHLMKPFLRRYPTAPVKVRPAHTVSEGARW